MSEPVIVSSVRTAVGKAPRGTLRAVRPETLGATAIRGALERVPGLEPARLGDVIVGCAMPEGPQGMNLARNAAALAGLPCEVPALTINRFCSSGLQAIVFGAQAIATGQAEAVVAGGVESMSAVPLGGFHFLPDPDLVSMAPQYYLDMGNTAENLAEKYEISREDADRFALESHRRAIAAIDEGRFAGEIVPLRVELRGFDGEAVRSREIVFDTDEGPRRDTSLEALARLRPVFRAGGTVTAGNASQTSDGAAASVLVSEELARELGLEPIARLASFAVAGVPPEIMGIGPVPAVRRALERAGLSLGDVGLFELNEAFAVQSLAVIRELELDPEKVNVNGGAIALGHPLGCTGAKLTATLLAEMQRRGVRWGVCTMCIGGGMGAAGVFENLRV
ncbi:MAG: thiolase family protein [Acidobacteria bacterium]|nr:MAG: thiolase family protein [Acidobacteriota bacterium]